MDLELQRFLAEAEAQDILSEVGKTISSKTAKSLDAAVKAMQLAMEQVAILLSDENEKIETKEGQLVETKRPVWMRWSFEEVSKILATDDSYDARRMSVQAALRVKLQNEYLAKKLANGGSMSGEDSYYSCYPYIRDLYDADVVYSVGDGLFSASYTYNDGVVVVGDGVPVKVSYVAESEGGAYLGKESDELHKKILRTPINERGEYEAINLGKLLQLSERAVDGDGKVQIKIISPGWGSSGYYSEKMLKRDGPKVFKKGTHMYINHPTDKEAEERPERDVRDLAGALLEDAKWESNGATGPGLYAPANVLSAYREFVDSAAPYIGTSIRASGMAVEGQAEGKYGMIVEELVDAHSVDYVTLPGRGGEVLSLLEAARTSMNYRRDNIESNSKIITEAEIVESKDEMNEDQIKALITESVASATSGLIEKNTELNTQLEESKTQIARMTEGLILRDAKDIVVGTLNSLNLPDMVKNRLAESCAKNPPVKDGALDKNTLVESVKAAATEEMKYVESFAGASGNKTGAVLGMGSTTELTEADADKALEEAFEALGFTEKSLKIAVKGRD